MGFRVILISDRPMSTWGYRVLKNEHSHAVTVIAKKLAYPLSLQFGVVTPLGLEGPLKKTAILVRMLAYIGQQH